MGFKFQKCNNNKNMKKTNNLHIIGTKINIYRINIKKKAINVVCNRTICQIQ